MAGKASKTQKLTVQKSFRHIQFLTLDSQVFSKAKLQGLYIRKDLKKTYNDKYKRQRQVYVSADLNWAAYDPILFYIQSL